MTFWNVAILGGLALAAVPVIIHILNRRKARVIDWGAMRFLELSLATRGRRILIEEIILLAIRTLIILLLVLAMARPLITNRYFAGRGAAQDVVILLDGSMSMAVTPPGGRDSYFRQGTQTALDALERLRSGDSVAVVLAGSMPVRLTEQLTYDHGAAEAAIREASVTEGVMNVNEALALAGRILDAGKNPNKRILLITDGRSHGWRVDSPGDWQSLAARLAASRRPPRLDVLALAADEGKSAVPLANLSIEGVKLSRPVVGTDLPVRLSVTVRNTGVEPSSPGIRLTLHPAPGQPEVDAKTLGEIGPMAQSTVQLQIHFDRPGPHLLHLKLDINDALPNDNQFNHSVEVMQTLPVLLVNGEPSKTTPDRDEVFWLRAAFQPTNADDAAPIEFLVRPTAVDPALLDSTDLAGYYAVVLANVSKISDAMHERLREFVRDGGGLLVAPGAKADRDFYNDVLYAGGAGLLPAALGEPADLKPVASEAAGPAVDGGELISTDKPARAVPITMQPPPAGHPALIGSAEPSLWPAMIVRRHYPLSADAEAGKAAVVLKLSTGEPYAYEHPFGLGRVVLIGGPLDADWSSAPLHRGYAIVANELMYYLSAPRRVLLNVEPGQKLIVPLPERATAATYATVTPPGVDKPIDLTRVFEGGRHVFKYAQTAAPGVYEVHFGGLRPPMLEETEAGVPIYDTVLYTVDRDPAESFMTVMEPKARERVSEWLAGGVMFHDEPQKLLRSMAVTDPGREIWKWLAVAVVSLLLLEILLSRWITARRQGDLLGKVQFGAPPVHTVR